MSQFPAILLRTEQKPLEHRSFSPAVIRSLVKAGYPVSVERSPTEPNFRRIFSDAEYEAAGAKLVPAGAWPDAAPGTLILGLKEIAEEEFALTDDHIAFAHCYKNQASWDKVLSRFARGRSVLYDLEFLVDGQGRRVSAFGYHAGFAGAALGVKAWTWQLTHAGQQLPSVASFTDGWGYYVDEKELVEQLRRDVAAGEEVLGRKPTVMVLGALGRCGKGACDLFAKAGIPEENMTHWDLDETRERNGPYDEIAPHDIFLNAVRTLSPEAATSRADGESQIYLSQPIPPFVDNKLLAKAGRKLSVVVDVSCDTTNPHNPIPIYRINTTFNEPTVAVEVEGDENSNRLTVISIDHLPLMLPREASEAFSEGLRKSLLQLKDRKTSRVWADAEKLFREKVALLPEGMS